MTNEQITQWAREAGMHSVGKGEVWIAEPKELQAFATLVRNATLETAALKCDAWVTAHCQATGECSYADCDMVAVATDLATEIRGMK